jgi:deoxyribodipyrimidine photolyase-like uncharacterized protein
MKFFLLSKMSFEISNPIALIKHYCCQFNIFYWSYLKAENLKLRGNINLSTIK